MAMAETSMSVMGVSRSAEWPANVGLSISVSTDNAAATLFETYALPGEPFINKRGGLPASVIGPPYPSIS
jgi:hypothetical protein